MAKGAFSKWVADHRDTILGVGTIVALLVGAASFFYGVKSDILITSRLNLMANHLGEITKCLERLQNGQAQITNAQLRLTSRLDVSLEAANISEKLSDELTVGTTLDHWRSLAVSSGYAFIKSVDPKAYSCTDQGRALVNQLDPNLFAALADSAPTYTTIVAQLKSVSLTALAARLAEYNIEHNTDISLETVLGILAVFLEPKPG